MTDHVIRRATAADLPSLGRLGATLMRVHYEFDHNRFMRPGGDPEGGYAAFLATQLDDPDCLVLVAERDSAVAGYVYAGIEPESWKELRERAGFIHDILVEQGNRRTGLAEALIDGALDWLRDRGIPRVLLWSAAPNTAAQRLFERKGFRTTMLEMTKELDS
ncbi:MAG TPA: GNAT family N-acetyltransferase [Vicinamibacterales bacterium]